MQYLKIALAIIFLFFNSSIQAQISFAVTGGLRLATEKVLNAYKQEFAGIKGELIGAENNVEIFASMVKPDGAVECTLTRFVQPGESLYTWEALILRTEDFASATRKYNACCMQLKGIMINTGNGICRFTSDYEPTKANKSFYSTLFTPNTEAEPYRKLRLEVLLEGDMTEWVVRVLVYDSDRKDTDGSLGR